MRRRFYQDDCECGCGRSSRRNFSPPPWACHWDWEDELQPTPKERNSWLEAIKTRLESRLEEINAEIEKVSSEQK